MKKTKKASSERLSTQVERDHRAKQLNSNNPEFWKSRGHSDRPTDWATAKPKSKHPPKQDE